MAFRFFTLTFASIALASPGPQTASSNSQTCKNVPSSPGWPSTRSWSQLNRTIGGHLLAPLPPAIVCDPAQKYYSPEKCASVGSQWLVGTFHEADPVSLYWPNWQNDSCLPTAVYNQSLTCDVSPFPKYTVNATEASHVSEALKFATQHNLRVAIKNTGHDNFGRSTSNGFSIWMHHMQGIEVHDTFTSKSCPKTPRVSALTALAGSLMRDIYSTVAQRNMVITGGADPTIGLGGYVTGGGHSPLGSMLGLAADNILEMQVVLPTGEFVTANACQNSDLFWAMRGGGGSTFGVLISATIRTHPSFPTTSFNIVMESNIDEAENNNNANFFDLLAYLHGQIVPYSDNNLNGYWAWGPASVMGVGPSSKQMYFIFLGWCHNKTLEETNQLMAPLSQRLNTTKGVVGNLTTSFVPSAALILPTGASTYTAGYDQWITSRIWPKEALTDRKGLLQLFDSLKTGRIEGLVVSGKAVRDTSKIGKAAVPAAWRTAYLHHIAVSAFPYRNQTARDESRHLVTEVYGSAQRKHVPSPGAYFNEADALEPNWTQTFWSDYPRLLRLKKKYDPHTVFWCAPCVGHEEWNFNAETGQLCRK